MFFSLQFSYHSFKAVYDRAGFFFFFLIHGYCAWSELIKIMKFLKLGEYFYVKEENFDRKYVSWKKYWLYYMIFLLYRLENWCVFKSDTKE